MWAGTNGVVGVGMTPNCRPERGGLAYEGPGISRTSPGEVVNSDVSATGVPCAEDSTAAVSSGVTSVG
jgi:hypothetical protein